MTCNEIDTLPYPACATTLIFSEATGPTAPSHSVLLRNLATDYRLRIPVTVDVDGTIILTLPQPLQAGHEYSLELLDNDGTDNRHELTLCAMTSYVVRLRPVLEMDGDGNPVQVSSVYINCA